VTPRGPDAESMEARVGGVVALRLPDAELKGCLGEVLLDRGALDKEEDDCDLKERCECRVLGDHSRLEAEQMLERRLANEQQLMEALDELDAVVSWRDERARVDDVWDRDSEREAALRSESEGREGE